MNRDFQIITVGHSSHGPLEFIGLLASAGVSAIADVRSQPSSSFASHFNQEVLRGLVTTVDIAYVWLGAELGGRPEGAGAYDEGGRVRYDRLSERPDFRAGIVRLLRGIRTERIGILCSEEDPTNCHRRLLVGRVLMDLGVTVGHLRGTGELQSEAQIREQEVLRYPDRARISLFGSKEELWRSIRSVSVATGPNDSPEAVFQTE